MVESGDWCVAREPLVRDLVAGTADEAARLQALEHLEHCRSCADLAARLSGHLHELGGMIALGSVAGAIGAGNLSLVDRVGQLVVGAREAATDLVDRAQSFAGSVAATGTGRGTGAVGAGPGGEGSRRRRCRQCDPRLHRCRGCGDRVRGCRSGPRCLDPGPGRFRFRTESGKQNGAAADPPYGQLQTAGRERRRREPSGSGGRGVRSVGHDARAMKIPGRWLRTSRRLRRRGPGVDGPPPVEEFRSRRRSGGSVLQQSRLVARTRDLTFGKFSGTRRIRAVNEPERTGNE